MHRRQVRKGTADLMKIDSGTSFLDNGRQGRLIGGDESNQECRWTRLEGEPRKSVYRYRYNLVGHRGSTIHGLVEDADTEQVARRLKNVYRQRAGESLGRAISKIGTQLQ